MRQPTTVRIFLLIFVLIPFFVRAQFEVEDLVTVPKTPEAAAFTEYANTASVSLYTGKASVSVPIDGLQGRKLSHPVSLTYLTGGIKVQQEAGIAGLGWNLNVGGMVTRNVNDLPDDYSGGSSSYYPFYSTMPYQWSGGPTPPIFDVYRHFRDNDYGVYFSSAEVGTTYEGPYQTFDSNKWHELYYHFLGRGDIELAPDTYSFSAGSISGTLVINYEDESAYCIEHPDYNVVVHFGATGTITGQKPIERWSITDNQGTTYEFGLKELTTVGGDDQEGRPAFRFRTYASGWYLTSIHNEYTTDDFYFNYESYTTAEYSMPGHSATIADRYLQGDNSDQYCGGGTTPNDPGTVEYQYQKNRLLDVQINGITRLELFYDDNRLDLTSESLLDAIEVRNVEEELINEYDFVYSYFGTPDGGDYNARLKLDEVWILGDESSTETQKYRFEYNDRNLPARDSFAKDYWGFYNGFDENQGLVPQNGNLTNPEGYTGNRSVVSNNARAGILERVHYPTGGSTAFEYASNGYHGNHNMETVQHIGGFYLDGGADSEATDPCDPQGGTNGAPFVSRDAMVIEETDVYTITLSASGGNSDAVQGAAFRIANFEQCEATNPTDAGSFDFLEFNPNNFGTVTATLEPGKYYVMLVNDQANTRLRLSVSRIITNDQNVTIPVGGLRVIGKENFDESGNSVDYTSYKYRDVTSANNHISGVLHHRANYEIINRSEAIYNSLAAPCESVTRFASNQNTPTPNVISYSTVSEMKLDSQGNPNGVTVYQFYNDFEGVGTRPFAKSKLKNGIPYLKRVYKSEYVEDQWTYDLQLSEVSDYHIEPLGGMVAYSFESQASAFLDPMLHENPDNADEAKWVYAPMYFTSLGLSEGASSGQIDVLVASVQTGSRVIVGMDISEQAPTEAEGSVGTHIAPCSFDHNSNRTGSLDDSDIIEDISNAITNVTEAMNNWLHGQSVELDVSVDFNPYLIECFPQPHQIPIKYKQPYSIPRSWLQQVSSTTTQYENGQPISITQTYDYDRSDNPTQYQLTTTTRELANQRTETIDYYYPADITGETGISTMLTQNRVAEPVKVVRSVDGIERLIKNTLFDASGRPEIIQIAHHSPEVNGDLEDYLEDRIVILEYDGNNNVRKLQDQSGLINYYRWGHGGHHLIIHLQTPDSDFESSLPAQGSGEDIYLLHHERYSALPSSIVNVYEYKPGKGLIRQIDPNGRMTRYEYDSFGRLLKVIDHEGHVLSQNEYHFANQND